MRLFKGAMLLAGAIAFAAASVSSPAQAGSYPPKYPKYPYMKHHHHHHKMHHHGHHGHHHHFSSQGVVWTIIGCAGGTVSAAMVANWRNHRELTAEEAWSCGINYYLFGMNN